VFNSTSLAGRVAVDFFRGAFSVISWANVAEALCELQLHHQLRLIVVIEKDLKDALGTSLHTITTSIALVSVDGDVVFSRTIRVPVVGSNSAYPPFFARFSRRSRANMAAPKAPTI
jgi:hypothetical protein